MTAVTTEAHCRNCASPLGSAPAKFCPQCGQTTRLHVPTVGEFVGEFANHYVALEGKLWPTLWTLVAKPGVLTRDYLEGRRERYVLPLRLFLTFSIVFFITFRFIDPPVTTVDGPVILKSSAAGQSSAVTAALPTPKERRAAAVRNVAKNGPYLTFFLLPFFTILLRGAFARRDLNFGSHLVFSFHFHCVVFMLFLAGLLAPYRPVSLGLIGIAMVYLAIAMQSVYGGRWWVNALRAPLLIALQGMTIFTAAVFAIQIPAA